MFDQQQATLKDPLTSLYPIRKKHHLKGEEVLFDEHFQVVNALQYAKIKQSFVAHPGTREFWQVTQRERRIFLSKLSLRFAHLPYIYKGKSRPLTICSVASVAYQD